MRWVVLYIAIYPICRGPPYQKDKKNIWSARPPPGGERNKFAVPPQHNYNIGLGGTSLSEAQYNIGGRDPVP
jgi:hypothetical protein